MLRVRERTLKKCLPALIDGFCGGGGANLLVG